MAKSIKYKEADTYHDAANVYDNTQGKTQEEINASMSVTDEASFTEQGYLVRYCKSGNVATVVAYRNEATASDVNIILTNKLPFRPWTDVSIAVNAYYKGNGFLVIDTEGSIRIAHYSSGGAGYKCVATFIAKDL